MSITEWLAELRERDVRVWADGDRVRCDAPAGVLTPLLRDQLRERKSDILQFLRSAEALAGQQRAIVPLQPRGRRVPVFGVGGHNGDVFTYRALVEHLGDDQPFYGLQPPGLDGRSEPLRSVEALASYFAEQVRAFQPEGPRVIAGYCAGGSVAFELGRQLLRGGTDVSLVALFGSPYAAWYRRLPQLRHRLTRVSAQAAKVVAALGSRPWRSRAEYVVAEVRRRLALREMDRAAAVDPVVVMRTRVEEATMAAVGRYTPGYFAGRVAVFLPNRNWVRCEAAPLRWRLVARYGEQFIGPDACELDRMLREPFAQVFAELFGRCRDAPVSEPSRAVAGAPWAEVRAST